MPKPNPNENEKDYVSRCIPIVIKEGTAKDEKQAAAICYSMWREHKKATQSIAVTVPYAGELHGDFIERCKIERATHGYIDEDFILASCEADWLKYTDKDPRGAPQQPGGGGTQGGRGGKESSDVKPINLTKGERVLLHLCAHLDYDLLKDSRDDTLLATGLTRSTVLVGDGIYNGIFFPSEEIEKAYYSWDKKPFLLDHSDKVEDTFGHIEEPQYSRTTKKFTIKPVIDYDTTKAKVAEGHIYSRLRAGIIPEISIGVWVDKIPVDNERKDGALFIATNLEGDHLALVTRGACSPKDGCGIGLEKNDDKIRLKKLIIKERIKKEELNV